MFLDIDGNRVFTLSFGKGPRTILAHGGWISNVEDWITTLAPLSTTWRTVTYDHRGAGLTRVPVDRISPQALVDDVFRVMDALDIERCVLAGFSRGTVTALRAVLAQPERFDGLVLMNGCGEVQSPDLPVRPRPAPSTWPGARAPHAWLKDRRSTLDLFGKSFVLLNFSLTNTSSLTATAKQVGVPLEVVNLNEPKVREIYQRDLVLVRPDGHVAWRRPWQSWPWSSWPSRSGKSAGVDRPEHLFRHGVN